MASLAGGSPRICAWTRRRRAWGSCCVRDRWRCRLPLWRAGRSPQGSPRADETPGPLRPGIWQDDAVESFARLVALIAGIALVLLTAWSVFTALVVPRVASSPAMRMLARTLGGSARAIGPKLRNYETRDRVLSFVGPAAMVFLFILWLCFIVLGIALIEWY